MPQTAAETKADFEDVSNNPTTNENNARVTITLTFEGVEFKPIDLYEALNAKWGTISNDKDCVSHNSYHLRITE